MKTGGLGMIAIGLCYIVFSRRGEVVPVLRGERMAPAQCHGGLVFAFLWATMGYVVCNLVWPNFFYFQLVQVG